MKVSSKTSELAKIFRSMCSSGRNIGLWPLVLNLAKTSLIVKVSSKTIKN